MSRGRIVEIGPDCCDGGEFCRGDEGPASDVVPEEDELLPVGSSCRVEKDRAVHSLHGEVEEELTRAALLLASWFLSRSGLMWLAKPARSI